MTYRERLFLVASDGVERTAIELAELMEINNPVLVTQHLMRLKMTLVQERSKWKLLKIMPEKANGAVRWKLEIRKPI
jgi:hypothetical protein